jgi:hypothetical protein
MTRDILIQKNNGVFNKIASWAESRKTQQRNNEGIKGMHIVAPFAAIGASIGTGVAVAPVALAVTTVALASYVAYKLQLDKAIVAVAVKMTDKVKSIFTQQTDFVKDVDKIMVAKDIQAISTSSKVMEPNEAADFKRMSEIVEAHNHGAKFDSQTGMQLGETPLDSIKHLGFNESQIHAWQNRGNIINQKKLDDVTKAEIPAENTEKIEEPYDSDAGRRMVTDWNTTNDSELASREQALRADNNPTLN